MRLRLAAVVSLAAFAAVLSPASARAAEGVGTIQGVVLDGSRNPVAKITVRATDVVDPSHALTTVTGDDGRYTLTNVRSGSYLISADTLNTNWIQKDESPVIEVSATGSPNVTLVLVKMAELAPVGPGGGGGGGWTSGQIVGVTLSGLALTGTIAGLIQLSQHSDRDKVADQNLQNAINDLFKAIKPPAPLSPSK